MTRLQRFLSLSWLSIGDKAFPEMGPNDIVPDHEKPTMILARMLAAEILQHLDVKPSDPVWIGTSVAMGDRVDRSGNNRRTRQGDERKTVYSFPSFSWVVYEKYTTGNDLYNYNPLSWQFYKRFFVLKSGEVANFNPVETKILSDAMDQRDKLLARKRAADAETARQQVAIDAIAKICKIPEKEDQ